MSLIVDIEKHLSSFDLKVQFESSKGVLALLGASGSGKSMTLKCIAGIERPDRGRIILDGRVLFDSEKKINLSPQKRRVGYLFQQYALFPNMTVKQNIRTGLRSKDGADEKLANIIRTMGLEECEKLRPDKLSGGQQQRVALARIMVNEPEVLLLDEPFSALDTYLRCRLERDLTEIIKKLDCPAILVSHDRNEVFRMSDNVAVMSCGKIDVLNDKRSVFGNPETRNAAILTGCTNISGAEYKGNGLLYAKDWGLMLNAGENAADIKYVGLRSENIEITEEENGFACLVENITENPNSLTYLLRPVGGNENGLITTEISADTKTFGIGSSVSVRFSGEKLIFLKE